MFYGETSIGKVRDNNEDSFQIEVFDKGVKLFVIADGMGGHNKGEFASNAAVNEIISYMRKVFDCNKERKSSDNIAKSLIKSIEKANEFIYDYASTRKEYYDMGTTVVVALQIKDKLMVCNVGDSRLYIIRDSELRQLTEDNTYIQALMKSGAITIEEASNHEKRNMILRAVGTEKEIIVDLYNIKLKSEDCILMCTDGLTDMVSEEEISDIIKNEKDATLCVKRLIEKANDAGGVDNITAIVYNYID